jgi:hypothetical protein
MNIYSIDPDKGHINQPIRDVLGLDDTQTHAHWVIAARDENRAVQLLIERGFTDITEHEIARDTTVNDLRSAGLLDKEAVLVCRQTAREGDPVVAVDLGGKPRRLGATRGWRLLTDADD